MEIRAINYSELLVDLGIEQTETGNLIDFESSKFRRYLIASIRRLYSTETEGIFARTVKIRILNQLKNLLPSSAQLDQIREAIADAHDLLVDVGEIVRVESDDALEKYRSQLSMYVLLSASARDKNSRALLLGPCWSLESVEIPNSITIDDSTGLRFLKGELSELTSFLSSVKLHSIPFEQWRGYPPTFLSDQLLSLVMDKLLQSRESREVRDLRVFEKGHQRYFTKRLRPLKESDNGVFVARRVAEYGADICFVVLVQNGICRKIISLPITEIADNEKDCERLLISVLDFEFGSPTRITVDKIMFQNKFDFAAINFFIPPISWMLKFLIASGNQLPRPNKGALFSFAVPSEDMDGILKQIKKDMFLEVG
jgi:hypothetical protein